MGSLALAERLIHRLKPLLRGLTTVQAANNTPLLCPHYLKLSAGLEQEPDLARQFIDSITIHYDFLSENEEKTILDEVEPYMNKLHYETGHWDDAILNYRETERLKWNEDNGKILDRVRAVAFPPGVAQLKLVHILDLHKDGCIKPHIDAIRFCGDTIAGLSLLTDSVMRLIHESHKEFQADILLKRRSLYIMRGTARYDYTHEILGNDSSQFDGQQVIKDRRISVICRNEPRTEDRQL